MKHIYIIITLLFVSNELLAQKSKGIQGSKSDKSSEYIEKIKSGLTPRTIQWQYAGNIGMHSIGADWNIYKEVFNVGLSLGYVPDSRSIEPLFLGNLHLNYNPKVEIKLKDKLSLKPLNFSFIVSTTYGKRFSIYGNTDHYPEHYYWWGVRTRFGLSHSLDLYYQLNSRFVKGVSLYFNSSVWDIEFYNVFGNDNLEFIKIPLKRLFTFGTGLRIHL